MKEIKSNNSSLLWGGLNKPYLRVEEADVVILGIPFDGATSFRKGAAEAPNRIREVSYHIPPTDEQGQLLSSIYILDLGNIEVNGQSQQEYFKKVEEVSSKLFGKTLPFFIGGDHSITTPLIKAARNALTGSIGIIHLDAHLDLCHELNGNTLSHGCTHRRVMELTDIPLEQIHFLGIRSFEVQELEFLQNKQANIYTAKDIHTKGVLAIAQQICECLKGIEHIYLTLDIDILDPGFAPGTGTPKSGGITSRQLFELIEVFSRLPIIGMDIVEVAPAYDISDTTSFVAQKALLEMWSYKFLV